jgi:hypothetical protein
MEHGSIIENGVWGGRVALRPIFAPVLSGSRLIVEDYVDFKWHPGMSLKQKQRSISELHSEANQKHKLSRPLEISSKSDDSLGVSLSSFNLKFTTKKNNLTITVETAFKGSKVFENGGPFRDIFFIQPKDAKRDPRLRESGALTGFSFFGEEWDVKPRTAFYDWVYINALRAQPDLASRILNYDYFTDIEFNPDKSVNCQARSAAIFCSLSLRGQLDEKLSSPSAFLTIYEAGIPQPRHVNYHAPLL